MPRPRRWRRVWFEPNITYFKPAGVRLAELEGNILTVDEFEAIRLHDLEELDQGKAAKKMNISQPTFHRLLIDARKKIADALVNGKSIKIEGGNYKMVSRQGFSRGRGRMGGRALGPGGECICPKCGYKTPHQRAIPCYQQKCPKCGTLMIKSK